MLQPETRSCVPNCKSGYQRSQPEWKLCAINERKRLIIDSWRPAPDPDQATDCMSNDETVAFHAEDKEFNPSDSTTVTAHKTTVICSSNASFTRPIQTQSQLSRRLKTFHVEISAVCVLTKNSVRQMDIQIKPGGDAVNRGGGFCPFFPRGRNRSATCWLTPWMAGLFFLYSRLFSICSDVSLAFLHSLPFFKTGIMRASSDGRPRASYCIGMLWLIELGKWKMKCQWGHSVHRAVGVCLWGN